MDPDPRLKIGFGQHKISYFYVLIFMYFSMIRKFVFGLYKNLNKAFFAFCFIKGIVTDLNPVPDPKLTVLSDLDPKE